MATARNERRTVSWDDLPAAVNPSAAPAFLSCRDDQFCAQPRAGPRQRIDRHFNALGVPG